MTLDPLTEVQNKRSAHGSIRGYLYQFEKSALEILNNGSFQVARIEGIEDLDIIENNEITATQIKYWESRDIFSNKSIAKPLFEMYKNFCNNQELKFNLYVYLSEQKNHPGFLSREDIVDSFSSESVKGEVENYSKELYEQFAKAVSITIGKNIKDQRTDLANVISSEMGCDIDDAMYLHLPMVVHHINQIACETDSNKRLISKDSLLQAIKSKDYFFAKWQNEYLSEDKLVNHLYKKLKAKGFNDNEKLRSISFSISSNNLERAQEIIEILSRNLKSGKALKSHEPWTVIISEDTKGCYETFKKKLITDTDIRFNDGMEHIFFEYRRFSDKPFKNLKGRNIICSASWTVRIVSLDNYNRLDLKQREVIASRSCWFGTSPDYISQDSNIHVVMPKINLELMSRILEKAI